MKFILQRLYHTKTLATGNYTCGFWTNEEETFRAFCLEDAPNAVKVKGETRIPAGFYELAIRKIEPITDSLKRHRIAYANLPWFNAHPNWYHIEVTKVPNYSAILVHSVGDDKDTMGCLGPGYLFDISLPNDQQAKSKLAVNDFYAIAYPILEGGGKCFIEIKDEQ